MRIQHRHLFSFVLFLFCTEATFFGKFCFAQVGMSWDRSYSSARPRGSEGPRRGPIASNRNANWNPIDFDSADRNDEQRRVLFDYYNANRFEVYSQDGVTGWDTQARLNPIKNCRRNTESRQNIDSLLGSGSVSIAPSVRRVYGPAATTVAPAHGSPQQVIPKSGATIQSPLNVAPLQPMNTPELNFSIDATNHDSNGHVGLPRDIRDELPAADKYDGAVGELPPEFEWDETLLEDLPELNDGAALPGNPLPPSSSDLRGKWITQQLQPSPANVTRPPAPHQVATRPNPSHGTQRTTTQSQTIAAEKDEKSRKAAER